MADYNLTDFETQSAELARRRRMAQLLQQQGMNPVRMPGNAPGSFLAPLAQMAQVWAGKSLDEDIGKEERSLSAQRSQAVADLQRDYPIGDIPAQPENAPVGVGGEAPVGPILPAKPGQTQEEMLIPWALKMAQIGGPFAQDIAKETYKAAQQRLLPMTPDVQARMVEAKEGRLAREADAKARLAETQAQRDATAQARAADTAQRAEAAKMRSEDTRLSIAQREAAARESAALRRELASQSADLRRELGATTRGNRPRMQFQGLDKDNVPISFEPDSGQLVRADGKPPMGPPMPIAMAQKDAGAMRSAEGAIDKANALLSLVDANKGAFGGLKSVAVEGAGLFGKIARSAARTAAYTDDERIARTRVANEGAGILHALYGAALTRGEERRANEFAYEVGDTPEDVASKIKGMMGILQMKTDAISPQGRAAAGSITPVGSGERRRVDY